PPPPRHPRLRTPPGSSLTLALPLLVTATGSDARLWMRREGVAAGWDSPGDARPGGTAMLLQLWCEGSEPGQSALLRSTKGAEATRARHVGGTCSVHPYENRRHVDQTDHAARPRASLGSMAPRRHGAARLYDADIG
ncbi:unnamed protein product, partial [Urochloa humidicola]